jgi:hypothetical protein
LSSKGKPNLKTTACLFLSVVVDVGEEEVAEEVSVAAVPIRGLQFLQDVTGHLLIRKQVSMLHRRAMNRLRTKLPMCHLRIIQLIQVRVRMVRRTGEG